MKFETSEEERTEAKRWYNKDAFSVRSARDIDTLLAEVERLGAERRPFSDGLAQKVIDEQVKTIDRLTAKLAATPPAPPLPAEVEEMRKKLEGPNEWGYRCVVEGTFISDPAPFDAASLLSRWPGVWRPIETAPKDGMAFLICDARTGSYNVVSYVDVGSDYCWEIVDSSVRLHAEWGTHWSPLPEPPNE